MWNVAIVGCGNIAKVHLEALKSIKNVNIKALADTNAERLSEYNTLIENMSINKYCSMQDMIDQENLDAVHICTPHYLHVPMALTALEKGIHVFLEKPPAINRNEYQKLQTAVISSGKRVGVCFQNRYNSSVLQAEKIIKENILGRIIGARAIVTWNRTSDYYINNDWKGKWETEGGGVLINQAIHTLDLLVHFLGTYNKVEANITNHSLKSVIEVEDTVEAYIEFQNTTACFYATNGYIFNSPIFIEIKCEYGIIRIEDNTILIRDENGNDMDYISTKKEQGIGKDYWGHSHRNCIEDFYHCMGENITYKNSLLSTKDTFDLVMGIYESAKKGNIVFRKDGIV